MIVDISDDNAFAPFSIVRRPDGTRLELGRGAMGITYKATDTQLNRPVALKVINNLYLDSFLVRQRFLAEARAAAQFQHQNVAGVFQLRSEGEVVFYAMEFVEGETLEAYVKRRGPLAHRSALRIILQAAQGLAAAQERGLIHRDIKPANLMLAREPGSGGAATDDDNDDGLLVKVIDFGLAKNVSGEDQGTGLTGGGVVGTPNYMSPEQVSPDSVPSIDCRTDVYSLGVTLWYLLVGRTPFEGSQFEILSQHLQKAPDLAMLSAAGVPPGIVNLIGSMLAKNRDDRPADHLALVVRLKNLLRSEAAASAETIVPPGAVPAGSSGATTLLPGPLSPAATRAMASIAVMPFMNRSNDQGDEYFADGLADELLNVLGKIRGLQVAARSSSFTFKGQSANATEVGRALKVASVLEGSVRKAGNRVRISVNLVKAADGFQVWAETYDRTLDDIFAVQDDIAQSVVKELRRALLGASASGSETVDAKAEVAAAVRGRSENPEAHRLFLLGRFLVGRATRDDLAAGIEHLREVLSIDPNHALAWAWLSQAHWLQANYDLGPAQEMMRCAKEAAARAVALEPDCAEGHLALGKTQLTFDWNWRGADESFRRALALVPNHADVLHESAYLARCLGRLPEAIALGERATELDPLNSAAYNHLCSIYRAAGRLTDAERAIRKALEISPQRTAAHLKLGFLLLLQNQPESALAEVERERGEVYRLYGLVHVHHAAGRSQESDRALESLTKKFADVGAYQIATAHAFRGELDAAFAWMEKAYEQRDAGLVEVKVDPHASAIRVDSRWPAFVSKMGFPD